MFLLLTLLACQTDAPPPLEVSATLSETILTVPVLDWQTEEPGTSWVEYGLDTSYGHKTPTSQEATTHHFPLLGLPALSTVWWHAVTETPSGTREATGSIDTLNLPSELPFFTVSTLDVAALSPEPWIMGVVMGTETGQLFVVDRSGQWVWYYIPDYDMPFPWIHRVMHDVGGQGLWYQTAMSNFDEGYCGLHRISLEGEELEAVDVPMSHHSFAQKPDGTLGVLVADIRPWYDAEEGRDVDVIGDGIVEVAPDRVQTTPFTTWDWLDVEKTARWSLSPYASEGDWTHANSIEWSEERGSWLVSFGHLDTVAQVDPVAGQVTGAWGTHGLGFTEGSWPFVFQHAAQWLPDGHLFLSSNDDVGHIIAVEYDLSGDLLQEVWSYGRDLRFTSQLGGQPVRLSNGNTLYSVGTLGLLREVTPAGDKVWELQAPAGLVFTWIQPLSDLYTGK